MAFIVPAPVGTIQVGGVRTYSSQADYEFSGGATGIFTTSTNPQVRNFIANNPGGNISLSQPVTVNGALTLTSGIITTTPVNLLTIGATGSATPATNISFVNGPIAKIFALPMTGFTFPVGKSECRVSKYRCQCTFCPPINLSCQSISGQRHLMERWVPALSSLSACEYWNLSRTAGAAGTSARVTLSWETGSPCGLGQYVTEQTSLRVAHLTGGTWVNEGYLGKYRQ